MRLLFTSISMLVFALCFSSCNEGGGGETGETGSVIMGRVIDATTAGSPATATVSAEGITVTTNETGYFVLSDMPKDAHVLLSITADGYAATVEPVDTVDGASTFVEVSVLPWGGIVTFDAAAGGTVTTGEGASVAIPPGALDATGEVTAYLAWLDAANDATLSALPGDFTTDQGETLESFGAVAIEVRDGLGGLVNLATGQTAAASIPVSTTGTDSIPLWWFDESTGLWVEQGTLTGCASGTCAGDLAHFSWWNADQVLETTCLTVCAEGGDGSPAVGITVQANGVDYNGESQGTTGPDGCACLNVKRAATVDIVAITSGGWIGPMQHTTSDTVTSCEEGGCEEVLIDGPVETAMFQAFLTWSEQPADLDSHFTGPCHPDDSSCTDRFHIYYGDQGSLFDAPWAYLDTDDTSSFGPEITSLARCTEGVYRYSVHNFSGSPGIETSSAEVIVFLPNGTTVTETVPSSNPSANLVWVVGDLTCNADCDCSWDSIGDFGPDDDTSYHP